MFLASSAKPIDENLKKLVDEIEAQSPSLSVLAAREFHYSLRQTQVEVNIKEPRQFNVLEEFIIRAAIEFQPPPTEDELASVLGLDSVFIKTTTTTLRSLQTLSPTSPLTVTPEGRSFYEKGSVPQPPYPIQIYAITDPLSDKITFQSESLNETTITLPDLADFITIDHTIADIASLPLEEIQKSIQASGLALHVPEEGKIVTSYRVLASTQKIWRKISLFVIFDALEDKLSIQIRNGKQILESASNWLEVLHTEGKISLQALCKLSTETINFEREAILNQKNSEIEARFENIRQKALEAATKTTSEIDNYKPLGEAVQLRDGQISLAFSEVLNSAKSQILIYSPWVNQAVVNEKFLNLLQKLANRGVRILIGHGIARRQEDEDKPIPPEVEKKLRAIKTPDGLPSVQVFWLGDSHVKEVIVDKQIHLCGSHNWLSYRGDYLPRGESVYKVTITHQVQEAYEFLANRFQNHAEKLWKNALGNRNYKLAIESLCMWGALGMEDIALKEIQQNNWLELLPVWLNVALQGLRSKNIQA
ncbi:phospholipase D-like domain-containing protein, partial [Nostoc sp. CHAB 5715]|uniref:phospholipase D-like domain-containing protein n=1 Tax=Nostoc sp. CHAB 5715 TaxID=2780400 RepID=UPI001E437EFC